jgi:trehalose utilization protein
MAHALVGDAIVDRVQDRVLRGMGLIVLHSGHLSKIFRRLMGTSCNLTWRDDDRERLWCCMPSHPIAQGLPPSFEIMDEEMYCEYFDIPQPDELVFLGWFKGGEVFRSGCCFHRGYGRIFYFQPGHEAHPTYRDNACVQQVITNAVRWAAPTNRIDRLACYRVEPAEGSGAVR